MKRPSYTPANSPCRYAVVERDSLLDARGARLELDDSGWTPGTSARLTAEQARTSAVWLRCRVPVDAALTGAGGVLKLGRVADVERTFFEGQEVGSTAGTPSSQWSYFLKRDYFVPGSLLPSGGRDALVAVRAESRSFGTVGFVDQPPALAQTWSAMELSPYEVLPLGFVALFLALLRLYPFNRDHSRGRIRVLTWLGAWVAAAVVLNSFVFYRLAFPHSNLLLRAHLAVTAVACWTLFRFLDLVLERPLSRFMRFWTQLTVVVACALPGYQTTSPSTEWLAWAFGLWGAPVLAHGAWTLGRVAVQFARKPTGARFSLLMGGLALAVLGGYDVMLLLAGKLPVSLPASGIGFLSFFVGSIFFAIAEDRERVIAGVRLEVAAQVEVAALASQVAHDIRSPLAALELLVSDLDSLPEPKRILAREAAQRINDIANGLLARNREITRTGAATATGAGDALGVEHLWGIVDQIVSEKRTQYRRSGALTLVSDASPDAYALFARVEPAALKRVLSNLLNNAAEAALSNPRPRVWVQLHPRGSSVQVSISDNGPGFAPELLPALNRIGEAPGTTTKSATGSGLGLYHARKTLAAWGGTLEILSSPGQGAQVTLDLPIAAAPAWFLSELRLVPGQTVVVVDDDPSIHQIWENRLGSAGVTLVHLSSGEAFKDWVVEELARVEGPASFLVDFELRGEALSGMDWIERLELQGRAVLVTSRFEDPLLRARCEEQGVRMIPKGLAAHAPLEFEAVRLAERPDCVLVDDDFLVQMIWQNAADRAGKRLLAFSSAVELEEVRESLPLDVPIYVDLNLGPDSPPGDQVVLRLLAAGHRHVALATGSHEEASLDLAGLPVAIVGKNPPPELSSEVAAASQSSGVRPSGPEATLP